MDHPRRRERDLADRIGGADGQRLEEVSRAAHGPERVFESPAPRRRGNPSRGRRGTTRPRPRWYQSSLDAVRMAAQAPEDDLGRVDRRRPPVKRVDAPAGVADRRGRRRRSRRAAVRRRVDGAAVDLDRRAGGPARRSRPWASSPARARSGACRIGRGSPASRQQPQEPALERRSASARARQALGARGSGAGCGRRAGAAMRARTSADRLDVEEACSSSRLLDRPLEEAGAGRSRAEVDQRARRPSCTGCRRRRRRASRPSGGGTRMPPGRVRRRAAP